MFAHSPRPSDTVKDGFVSGTNAVRGTAMTIEDVVAPIGSFPDPEYARAGTTEAVARQERDVRLPGETV